MTSLITCLLVFSISVVPLIHGHTIHMGTPCASVEPMKDFDMKRFLGKWYAIQKTSTNTSPCMTYTFEATNNTSQYKLHQVSANALLDVITNNTYKYRAIVKTQDQKLASDMLVKYPLNVIGDASFIVFMTDYENYAGIYTCQSIAFTHRHSATILSRTPLMDVKYVEKVRNRLGSFNVNPFDLTQIKQVGCFPFSNDSFTIDVNEDTLSRENVKKTLKKVGAGIKEGATILVNGVKRVYNSITEEKNKSSPAIADSDDNNSNSDVEELMFTPAIAISNNNNNNNNNDVEEVMFTPAIAVSNNNNNNNSSDAEEVMFTHDPNEDVEEVTTIV